LSLSPSDAGAVVAQPGARSGRPTIVLVHGAFAESSSWAGIITPLLRDGYRVRALALPLRGLESDTRYVASSLQAIEGPIVLVGHSYGGMVMSGAATGNGRVKALVFVAGFAPERGESAAALSARFPGSTLASTLTAVSLPGGGKDLYIAPDKYPAQFAADVPPDVAGIMAATQRPITETALTETAGAPAWRQIPSWFFFGELDKNIPVAVHRFMAQRASARRTVEVTGASHSVAVSHPADLVRLIREASTASATAERIGQRPPVRQGRRPPAP
jgi:pimeloyl-ACP methyl ester carboxylesterase